MKFEDVRVGDVFESVQRDRMVVLHKMNDYFQAVHKDGMVTTWNAEGVFRDQDQKCLDDRWKLVSRNQRVIVTVEK